MLKLFPDIDQLLMPERGSFPSNLPIMNELGEWVCHAKKLVDAASTIFSTRESGANQENLIEVERYLKSHGSNVEPEDNECRDAALFYSPLLIITNGADVSPSEQSPTEFIRTLFGESRRGSDELSEGLRSVSSGRPSSDLNYDTIENMIKSVSQLIESEQFATANRALQKILQKSEGYGSEFTGRDDVLKMQALTYWHLGKSNEAGKVFDNEFREDLN